MVQKLAVAVGITTLAAMAFAGGSITIKGSDTMVILGQRWAEHYMKGNKGVTVQVTGGGSGTGIAALTDGSTDIAQCSRAMKDKEKQQVMQKRGVPPVEIATAMDGMGVYVHQSNPVARLTLGQIKAIYQSDIANWKEVGGRDAEIVLYSRENNSGTYVFFKDEVLQKEDFAPTCQTLPGTASVINAVSKDPNAIGYGGIGYSSGVKVLAVAMNDSTGYYEPTEANVASEKYPLARYLYWYTAGEPTGEVKKLVDWVLGPEGQKVITEVGYYLLPKKADATASAKHDG